MATVTQKTETIFDAIIQYKQANDGLSPSFAELSNLFNFSKSQIQDHINRLIANKLVYKTPGDSRNLGIVGGVWQWKTPRPVPPRRAGDVLRVIIDYKLSYDGNAPSHRQIAETLDLSYTGDIKGYMDELVETKYLRTEYATDRYIIILGGQWQYDPVALEKANPNIYRQNPLLPFD